MSFAANSLLKQSFPVNNNALAHDQKAVNVKVATHYNTSKVNSRQTIIVGRTALGNNTTFNFRFDTISFIPDVMIVRNTSYIQTAGNNTLWYIWSDIGAINNAIATFGPSGTTAVNSSKQGQVFQIQKPIGGNYTFKIYDSVNPNNLTTAPDATGSLALTLEFIKYDV
jgi:hypothetical protein